MIIKSWYLLLPMTNTPSMPFEQEALDYLLKPFDQERFELLMNRLRTRLHDFYHARDNYILVKENNELVRVKPDDIIFIQSDNNNVLLHIDGHTYKKRISLSLIQQQLNKHFIKIHRSYIINERKIRLKCDTSVRVNTCLP